ncbi:FlaA1/EpsC-like NDP-sugar epimerase [Caldicoprobacter guelmensis]|nr:FlaA1/EpsC-like NDP-sugar epimerase [Caldicoprobacter guelmensis]
MWSLMSSVSILPNCLTIPKSVQFVIQAGAMAKGGEIFVLDMGEPVKIVDLARDLIRLSGFESDVEIKY